MRGTHTKNPGQIFFLLPNQQCQSTEEIPVFNWPWKCPPNPSTTLFLFILNTNKLCAWRHNMSRPSPPVGAQAPRAPPSRRKVAVLSHAEYVRTLTAAAALRVKAALSKAAWWPWPLTLKVVFESRVTWSTSVPILVFLGLSFHELGPMYATDRKTSDRQTDIRRQIKASLNYPAY